MNNLAFRFNEATAEKLGLDPKDGGISLTHLELASKLTTAVGHPVDPKNVEEDMFLYNISGHVARGLIDSISDWNRLAFVTGLDCYYKSSMEITKVIAASWFTCLMFMYYKQYGDLSIGAVNPDHAYGNGVIMNKRNVINVAKLPDLAFDNSKKFGIRIAAQLLFEYTNRLDEKTCVPEEEKNENKYLEIYFDTQEVSDGR